MSKRKSPNWPVLAGGLLGWLAAFVAIGGAPGEFGLTVGTPAVAAEARPASRARGLQKAASKPQTIACCWQVLETANFRILSYGVQPVDAQVGQACECLRNELCAKWHAAEGTAAWCPKCDVVLHPSDASYLREVGAGGGSTVASSLVDHKDGSISLRRVDVRSQQSHWQTAALPHELTHVILADCFLGRLVPRWIDEGAALLADPAEKQLRHKAEMAGALADRSAFRVIELMTLEDYPAGNRWGAFYGQSLSLVEYLTKQRSTDEFIRFVQLSFDKGYDASLREVYGLADVAALERSWQSKATLPPQGVASRGTARDVTLAEMAIGGTNAN
jgi:hypothetical protein